MSQFCGKCDFYDSFVAIRSDGEDEKIIENLKGLELYVRGKDGRRHQVKSDTIKDITKYYPYLESVRYGNQDGYCVIILASDSFIDQEEREHLSYYVRDVEKYYNRCKRKKIPFVVDECVKEYSYWTTPELCRIIAERFEQFGKKADFSDLHLPMHEYYRKRWFEEMVRVGYTEHQAYDWVYKGLFDPPEVIKKRLGRPLKDEN